MPYINPADKLGFLFEEATKQGMGLMPQFIADKRQREILAQQQKEWSEGAEGRQVTTEHDKFVNKQLQESKDLFNKIRGMSVPDETAIQQGPTGATATDYGPEMGHFQPTPKRSMTAEETVRKVVESGLGSAYGLELPKEEKQKTKPKTTTHKIKEVDDQGNTWEWIENENEEIIGKKHRTKLAPKEKPLKDKGADKTPGLTYAQGLDHAKSAYYVPVDPNDPNSPKVIDPNLQAQITQEYDGMVKKGIKPEQAAITLMNRKYRPQANRNTGYQSVSGNQPIIGSPPKIPIPSRPMISNQPIQSNAPKRNKYISQPAPERGLTEEDILYNMKVYGKTREEVVDKYNKMKGLI